MIVLLNGQFVPESDAKVSVFDRSFLYGDGLFETVRVSNRKPFRLWPHLERLEQGARFLGIKLPYSANELAAQIGELIARNALGEALLRVTLSRGVGIRGYSAKGAERPTLVMSLHPFGAMPSKPAAPGRAAPEIDAPLRWRAHTAAIRLPAGDASARFKTCNKLAQVLAKTEAEAAGADEALLLNTDGFVVESSSGNLFWVQAGSVCTPPLADGILKGITRGVVLELCERLGLPVREENLRPEELPKADAAFLSLSSFGIVELAEIDGTEIGRSPIVTKLFTAYSELMRSECA